MSTSPRTFEEFFEIYKNEAQENVPELTDFTEGSINDIFAGSTAMAMQELTRLLIDCFRKTYIGSAEGDDLEFLATDHFGDDFAKPGATASVGIIKFSRPTAGAGDVTINAGTVVKTEPDANGSTVRFQVVSQVILTGLEIEASVEAIEAGPSGDVATGEISVIETALTDSSITVTNEAATSGGEDIPDDDEYREIIYRLIKQLKGATCDAIEAAAQNVAGIETVTIDEALLTVKLWNEALSQAEGDPFRIVRATVYVADANGEANDALLANVVTAVNGEKACGVNVEVAAANALALDWDVAVTLDAGGPNFASLSNNLQPIFDSMADYIRGLAIGTDFSRALGEAAILAIWGPAGTGDLTAFDTLEPTGDVAVGETQKLIPGTMSSS